MKPFETSSNTSSVEAYMPVKGDAVTRKRTRLHCTLTSSSGASTPRSGIAKIAPTASERAARVRKLQTLTQSDYNQLLNIVKAVVPAKLCDPHDALSHGLLIALQKYEGNGPLTAYVPRCAFLYGLQQAKKCRHQFNFCDLQSDEDLADYLDSVLPYLEDRATSRR